MNENNQVFLEEDGVLPLYYQLSGIIKREITEGSIKPGDRLPSEKELCEKYKISRVTVRQALLSLVREGLLYRKQGKGTFIAEPKLPRSIIEIYNFSKDMEKLKLIPTSKVLEQKIILTTEDLSRNLQLKINVDKVIKLTRVRLANNEPLIIETAYIPDKLAPRLIDEDMERSSLYSLLNEKYRLLITNAVETYEAISIDKKEAKLLNCKSFSPGFFIERIAYLENGTPVEFSNSIVRADRCKLVAKLHKKQTSIRRKIIPSSETME